MAALTSKVQICNLANGSLGNRNTINNIDTPKTDKEIVYSLWYDTIRQLVLKTQMPNFALNRIVVSQVTVPAGYTKAYSFAYEYPNRCLRLLGIGDIDCIDDPPTVENSMIFTNVDYSSAAYIRFVDDVTDVSRFTPEFIISFATELSKWTSLSTTQDPGKKADARKEAMLQAANATAVNAMENKPIRRNTSRFRAARQGNMSTQSEKK